MFFNNLIFRLYVRLKFWLSFRRQTWRLSDYPIRYNFTPEDAVPPRPDLLRVPWCASVYGWYMLGMGDTKAEALAQLRHNFDEYVERGYPLPRPGVIMPVPTTDPVEQEISKYEYLWDDFLEHILQVNSGKYFISDRSDLLDFIFCEHSRAQQNRLVALRYGVDISDIEDGNLLRIFQRIDAHSPYHSGRRVHGSRPE